MSDPDYNDFEVGRFVKATRYLAHTDIPEGLIGIVILVAEGGHGPLVRWSNGYTCNVYRNDAEPLKGRIYPYNIADMHDYLQPIEVEVPRLERTR